MTFRRTMCFFDKVTDIAALIVFIFLFLIGMYSIYDSYMVTKGATDDSILKYKPGYDDGTGAGKKKVLPGMVAWLTVDGTKIDYPVMQGEDNMEFLNKDPFGDYSLSGSIFLDSRNKSDFSDKYNLIYGHHMDEGAMFGVLDMYLEENFLRSHSIGKLTVGDVPYGVRFYAAFHADATNSAVFSPGQQDVIAYAQQNDEVVVNEWAPEEGDRLVALSTCRYPESTERTVLLGVLYS